MFLLPTHTAEWEYACRARTATPFHFGETLTTDLAKYNGSYTFAKEKKGIYRKETTPVGSFLPNDFGLYDIHGNVWEWCKDHDRSDLSKAPKDGSAWVDENAENDDYSIFRAVTGSTIRGLAALLVAPRTTPLSVTTLPVFVWSIAPQGLNFSPYY